MQFAFTVNSTFAGLQVPSQRFVFSRRQKHQPLQKKNGLNTYKGFVKTANPRFQFFEHNECLTDVCERIAAGELKRVMIFLPPRHSKSEMFSRLFSAYYLKRFPHHWVGLNSYAAELAYTLSNAARANFVTCGGELSGDSKAKNHWETTSGGGMWAAGVGGPITGKGFHLGIIDDPVKNSEDANSDILREKQKEWYKTTFLTREEPDAAIVLIMTRWNEDDLAGWLLNEELTDEDEHGKENWHIVCLPAISEEPIEFPETCTVEPDFRTEHNEPLCPERYPYEKLLKKKAKGEREFNALYQQRPSPKEGYFFNVTKLEIVDAAPATARRCRGWDKAATSGGGDFTEGVKVSVADGITYIEDCVSGQWDTATRDRTIRQTAELDGKSVHQKGEQEPGSGGLESAQNFIRLLAGFPVTTERSTANKEERADPFSSQVNAGNVKLVRGDWVKTYIEQLRQFPFGKHDDKVDASSLAFNHLNSKIEWSHATARF